MYDTFVKLLILIFIMMAFWVNDEIIITILILRILISLRLIIMKYYTSGCLIKIDFLRYGNIEITQNCEMDIF